MPWITPRTWVRGDFPTVGRLNTDLRDNMLFLGTVLGARCRNSSVIPIGGGGTAVTMTYDTEDFDTDNMHSMTSQTGRLVAKTAGNYMVGAHIQWQALGAVTTQKQAVLYANSGGTDTEIARHMARGVGSSENNTCWVDGLWAAQVGDYFHCDVLQDSGSTINVQVLGYSSPAFWAYRVGQ
jgi:hypothetical protein